MLPKSERLTKSDVEAVLATGHRHSSRYFFATVLPVSASSVSSTSLTSSPSSSSARTLPAFAVVVSKKTADTAVERNKLRRRTYSAIRAVKKIVQARPIPVGKMSLVLPAHVVVVVKREAKPAKPADLLEDMGQILKISGVI